MKKVSDIPEGVSEMPENMPHGKANVFAKMSAIAALTAALSACGGGGNGEHKPPVGPVDPETPTTPETLPAVTVDVGSIGKGSTEIALDKCDPRITSLIVNALTGDVTCAIAKNADGTAKLVIAPTQDGVEAETRCSVDGTDNPSKITVEQHADYNLFADTAGPVASILNTNMTVNSDMAGKIKLSDYVKFTDKSGYTVSFNPPLPRNITYNQEDGTLSYAQGTEVYVWNQQVLATDKVNNPSSPVQIKLNIAPTPEQPITPPPVTPTCPPGTEPSLDGTCA